MPLPICATVLGLLCLTGERLPIAEAPPGLFNVESVQTRTYSVSLMRSDLMETYYPARMSKSCEGGSCYVYKVSYRDCEVQLVLFPDRGRASIGPTGVSYDLTATDGSGLERALSEVYVIADDQTNRPLFTVSKLIDAPRAMASCKH